MFAKAGLAGRPVVIERDDLGAARLLELQGRKPVVADVAYVDAEVALRGVRGGAVLAAASRGLRRKMMPACADELRLDSPRHKRDSGGYCGKNEDAGRVSHIC